MNPGAVTCGGRKTLIMGEAGISGQPKTGNCSRNWGVLGIHYKNGNGDFCLYSKLGRKWLSFGAIS